MADQSVEDEDEVIACLHSEREQAIRGGEIADTLFAFEPHGGPVWLRLRGSPRVQAFIAETFTSRVDRTSLAEGVQP